MTTKIIISATESIVCPKCNHHFSLNEGITRQTIERYWLSPHYPLFASVIMTQSIASNEECPYA